MSEGRRSIRVYSPTSTTRRAHSHLGPSHPTIVTNPLIQSVTPPSALEARGSAGKDFSISSAQEIPRTNATIRSAAACLAFVGAASGPARATLVTSHISSDAALLARAPVLTSVTEGRIGDQGNAATFEFDLCQETAHPAVQEQYGWVSGQPEPFTLSYDAGTHLVTFQLGGKTL